MVHYQSFVAKINLNTLYLFLFLLNQLINVILSYLISEKIYIIIFLAKLSDPRICLYSLKLQIRQIIYK